MMLGWIDSDSTRLNGMYGDGRRREEDWNADEVLKKLWWVVLSCRWSWDYIGERPTSGGK
jgi:hypothetical protein